MEGYFDSLPTALSPYMPRKPCVKLGPGMNGGPMFYGGSPGQVQYIQFENPSALTNQSKMSSLLSPLGG